MISEENRLNVIAFFESISKYYGCETEITEGLYTDDGHLNADTTTWNLSEFTLIRSAYRNNGARLMMEGERMYYEISAEIIVDFKQPGRNTFEFIEQYGVNVFRITKIRFHYKY
ncbi:MAG: hypothetical protein CFE23_01550 [Flavobacterium sp. BFFFF1]|uniref:hypothetical protein n=1 Tax=Flavobacterium sp. BFFFF1 TaxID=2015557 RepID=UPI000BD443E0|nr:hypothetical protein [Flavobacterium sp. BFFFF1]OYU82013.1 MAG: hypothetical protein CFE23_01550 [Flavobacterium sp. BFFFF1]